MCSIAGSPSELRVDLMLDIMKHRSPDGVNSYSDSRYTIGMGRLAIIDLDFKDYPLIEDNLVLSFNGEIYNYLELRRELEEKGYKFKTKTDIEVLLKAYQAWGLDMFDKLNGMFAFAIYDGKQIVLARDIAGEKPLYFKVKPEFEFASEAKALNWDCFEFPPAHYAIYDFKDLKVYPYWFLKPRQINPETMHEELESLLEDSIRLRTRSDVPYALYYSGGIDSSLIQTFHNFDYQFTYQDKDYMEEFKEIFPKICYHLDYPIKSFSAFGLWKLAEEASKQVKVVLSGEGADELFGGYIRYVLPEFEYQARKQFPSYHQMFQHPKSVHQSGLDEFNGNMQELLRMGDRMASAWGIENRCPFLDKRIIEFAFSLPNEMKIKGLETKVILRDILRKRNPDYQFEEKKGLYCSVNKWLGIKKKFDKDKYLSYQQAIFDKIKFIDYH